MTIAPTAIDPAEHAGGACITDIDVTSDSVAAARPGQRAAHYDKDSTSDPTCNPVAGDSPPSGPSRQAEGALRPRAPHERPRRAADALRQQKPQ